MICGQDMKAPRRDAGWRPAVGGPQPAARWPPAAGRQPPAAGRQAAAGRPPAAGCLKAVSLRALNERTPYSETNEKLLHVIYFCGRRLRKVAFHPCVQVLSYSSEATGTRYSISRIAISFLCAERLTMVVFCKFSGAAN